MVSGRKRAHFDENRVSMIFEDGWWDGALFAISEEELEERVRQLASQEEGRPQPPPGGLGQRFPRCT